MDGAMQSLCLAMEQANPLWQLAVYRLGWSHAALASAYALSAWLCFLNLQIEEGKDGSCGLWWAATVILCLLGVNVVLQADEFLTQTLRALARLQGWYVQRRLWQYLLVGVMVLAVLLALNSKLLRPQSFWPYAHTHTGVVRVGLLALLLLLALRLVSAHGTDAALNVRFLGVSMGRLFELACLTCVMWGLLYSRRRPFTNSKTHLTGIGRHV